MRGRSFFRIDDRGGAMPADIEKTAQGSVSSAHDHERLAARRFARHELPSALQLFDPPCQLPPAREHRLTFGLQNARVGVPPCRNARRLVEGRVAAVVSDEVSERT